MVTGYRTDLQGNVLDYFDLPVMPDNTEMSLYVAATTMPPLYVSPAQASAILIAQAQAALLKSDMTAIRCYKAGTAFPSAWQTYVTALRAIVTSGTGALPLQPAYPSGT